MDSIALPSTRPYLIRAIHQWCCDHGYTPYLAVAVDGSVRVPVAHVVNGEIVLNISADATSGLDLGQDDVRFHARFGGVPQLVCVPVDRVMAIYARENGQGMAFPIELKAASGGSPVADDSHGRPEEGPATQSALTLVEPASVVGTPGLQGEDVPPPSTSPGSPKRAALKRVK
jgi:stringent starvation protein B